MKTIILAAAGLAAVAVAPAASAQVHRETRTVTTRTVVRQHTGPAAHRTRRVCTVRYNHHRKVRTCRVVRY